jgi:probable HAF family extracellular repeat protein
MPPGHIIRAPNKASADEGQLMASIRSVFHIVLAVVAIAALTGVARGQSSLLVDLGPYAPGLAVNNSGQAVLPGYFYGSGTLRAFPAGFTGGGINDAGQVVGTVVASCANGGVDGVSSCFAVWASGTLTTEPGDPAFPDLVTNYGLGINNSGQLVGFWQAPEVIGEYTGAILFSGGVFSGLAFPYPPGGPCPITYPASTFGPPNDAYAINDAGQIVGQMQRWNTNQTAQCVEAFLYSGGAYTDIGPGAALALNASGQVVGELQPQASVAHAFLYDPASGAPAQDLGTLPGGASSYAYGINAAGLVVGGSSTQAAGGYPVVPSSPLNNYQLPGPASTFTAFLYNGVLLDLNTFVGAGDPLKPFVTLTDARGINDNGLIIVNGIDSRDQMSHAYLLQAPLIQVAPGPLTFASESRGSQSPPQTLTFTNVGAAAVALGTASISTNFLIQSNGCGSSLGSGNACAIAVVFAPSGGGSPSGALTLAAGGLPIAVPLLSPLSVSISASGTAATTASGVTLSWSAAMGSSCTATGGSAGDGWLGAITASGSKSVKEAAPGSYTYGISCSAGPQTQSAQAPAVTVSWAPASAQLAASATTLQTGQSTTLSWSSANTTTCTSSGGGSNDGWPASGLATSGSKKITEPNPVITGGSETLTFTITCTSSASSLSATASLKVVQLDTPTASGPPASSGGGGGTEDPLALLVLAGLLAAIRMRRQKPRLVPTLAEWAKNWWAV